MIFLNSIPGSIAQGLVWCVMAIGVYLSYKVLDFADLTVDGSLATGGAVAIMLISAGVPTVFAVLIAFVVGLACGLCTGLLHTALGIPPILAGILMQLGLYSINLAIMGFRANMPVSPSLDRIITLAMPVQTLLFMLAIVSVIIAILYWFFGTQLGCSIRATGCNEKMARAQGINTNKTKVLGLMLSNGLVALCGGLLTLYSGFADVNMGRGAIVIGLAAVIIGGVVVSKLPKNFAIQLLGVVCGSIIYYLVYTFVINLGLRTDWLKLISAIVVAIFLSVPYFRKKHAKVKIHKNSTIHAGGGNENA